MAGDLIPYTENELQAQADTTAVETPEVIPYSETEGQPRQAYLTDKDEIVEYSFGSNEDELNHDLQTQIYGKSLDVFFFGIERAVPRTLTPGLEIIKQAAKNDPKSALDVVTAFPKGIASFAAVTPPRTLGGLLLAEGEKMQTAPTIGETSLFMAGMGVPYLTQVGRNIIGAYTQTDEEILKYG